MLFNSIEFAIFLPIVFALYWWLGKRLSIQNLILVVSGFIFYGWWDWKFLILLVVSSGIDFVSALFIAKSSDPVRRKVLLMLSIACNLGILGFFKYFNFFVDSFVSAFRFFGHDMDSIALRIILPVGVSFYTFQALSYTIDVYRNKLVPTKNILTYLSFISFFPQLVAGPIERATNMLPQYLVKRVFDPALATDGLRQMLWGLFKKLVIADNIAPIVKTIFANYNLQDGNTLIIGAVLFAFQIYCDFSGYSDIALGTARLFGFKLMQNFNYPYFSRDIAEFWRRWHISLSSWFRDYVYIPLGGSKGSIFRKVRNIFIIFLVSGLWHGANWTFIAWGFINALYFVPLMLTGKNRNYTGPVAEGKWFPSIGDALRITVTFLLVTVGWVFFRAKNIEVACAYLKRGFLESFLCSPGKIDELFLRIAEMPTTYFILFMLIVEWLQRSKQHGMEFTNKPTVLRWGMYLLVSAIIIFAGAYSAGPKEFIYFQF